MAPRFSRAELADAFATFEAEVDDAASTHNWDAWVAHYTDDVDYIEHAMGTMKGRGQVRDWIYRTMTTFPGSHMTAFPSLWHVIDDGYEETLHSIIVETPSISLVDGASIIYRITLATDD